MNLGLLVLAASSVLHSGLVATGGSASNLAGASSESGASSPAAGEAPGDNKNATIRALDQEWTLLVCVFSRREYVPCKEVLLVNRSYSGVAFQETITASEKSCDGAHALLLKQNKEESRFRPLLRDPHLYRKKFYSTYKYKEKKAKTCGEAKSQSDVLQIPRCIVSGASTHRLAAVNILEDKDRGGVVHNCLQLSYENVPSQCKCSPLFKPLQAKVLKKREKSYRTRPSPPYFRNCEHCGNRKVADSDGDTNVVKLSVAATLTEWLGQGVCAQVGRGGYSTSHEGMVHAFLLLTPESSWLVKNFMDENAPDAEEALDGKEFVRTEHDIPCCHDAFLGFINLDYFTYENEQHMPEARGHTYRAIVSNHRQESRGLAGSRPGPEMMLLPTDNGVMTIGRLQHFYCIEELEKYTKNMVLSYNTEIQYLGARIMDSPRHRAMRQRAALGELMPDVDAANAKEKVDEARSRTGSAPEKGV